MVVERSRFFTEFLEEKDSAALSVLFKEVRRGNIPLQTIVQEAVQHFDVNDTISDTAETLVDLVEGWESGNAYHNKGHMRDVVCAYVRLASFEPSRHFSTWVGEDAHFRGLGLLAALGHDFMHPGGCNPKGKDCCFEQKTIVCLRESGVFKNLDPSDENCIMDAILNTDFNAYGVRARTDYTNALRWAHRRNGGHAVTNALLRQADIFRSIGLTLDDSLECGAHLKEEFQVAAKTNCPFLAGQAFVDGLDSVEGQKFFITGSPCYLHSPEGERLRNNRTELLQQIETAIGLDI